MDARTTDAPSLQHSQTSCKRPPKMQRLESLSKDVFERRTSTGSEVFSLTICLDAKNLVLISFFSLIRKIYLKVSTKPPPNDAKRPLPVDVRRSKTLLLKLPTEWSLTEVVAYKNRTTGVPFREAAWAHLLLWKIIFCMQVTPHVVPCCY